MIFIIYFICFLIISISIFFISLLEERKSIKRAVYLHNIMVEILSINPDLKEIESYLNILLKNKRISISKKKVKEAHEITLEIIKDMIEENKINSEVKLIPHRISDNIYESLKKLHKDEK